MKSILATLALLLICGVASAGNVTLNWTAPTECDDGSAIAANCPTTGYFIFMGTSETGTGYGQRAESPAATATSIQLVNVAAGTRCFFMKTKSNALVSGESNRVCLNVPAAGPKALFINVSVAIPPP